jgi:hypothetical protein
LNVAIVGSRTFKDYKKLKEIINSLNINISKIISGGANGADKLGELLAKENNIDIHIFYPDWNKYGKKAGFIRNEQIVKNSDLIIAFWDGKSKGTLHSINLSKKYNKDLIIYNFIEDKIYKHFNLF